MGDPEYYKKLVKAAKSKNKSELEIYRNISKNVDEILVNDLEQDKSLLLKSLITYFEGEAAVSLRISILQIAYAMVIGVISIAPGSSQLGKAIMINSMVVVCIILMVASKYCKENNVKMVLCVLNDKLSEMSSSQNNIDISLEINDNTSNSKCKNKKSKKHKEHKK